MQTLKDQRKPSTEPSTELSPGHRIKGFTILKLLGKGGFSQVYLAKENKLDRLVALKLSQAKNKEDRHLASLDHDHIVKIFSSFVDDDTSFIAMQFVEGCDLSTIISSLLKLPIALPISGKDILSIISEQSGKNLFSQESMTQRHEFSERDLASVVIWLGEKLGRALHFAHENGLLHLDIKPGNILMSFSARPFLTDFNVSWHQDDILSDNLAGVGGTPAYMSPEQQALFSNLDSALVKKIGPWSDVFSLGKVLSELLVGRTPSEYLTRVLERATEPDPDERYRSALDFSNAISGCAELSSIQADLPAKDLIWKVSEKKTFLALTLWGAIPQTFALLIALGFNQRLLSFGMDLASLQIFKKLNLIVLPGISIVASIYWILNMVSIRAALKSSKKLLKEGHFRRDIRNRLLKIPNLGLVTSTLGWIPCAFIYAWILNTPAQEGVRMSYLVFLNFLLSWLVATSYSFLFHQKILLQCLYPQLLLGDSSLWKITHEEIRHVVMRSRLAALMTGLIPLFAAFLALSYEIILPVASGTWQRIFMGLCIGLGTTGIFLSSSLVFQIIATVKALQRKI